MRAFLITKVSLLTDLINSFGENADDAFANKPQMPQLQSTWPDRQLDQSQLMKC